MNQRPIDILAGFMDAWKEKDFERMAKVCQLTWLSRQENSADALEALFGMKALHSWRVKREIRVSTLMMDAEVLVNYKVEGLRAVIKVQIAARMIREKEPYRTSERGKWGVNPISVLREASVEPYSQFTIHEVRSAQKVEGR